MPCLGIRNLLIATAIIALIAGCSKDPNAPQIININFDPAGPVDVNTDVYVTASVTGTELTYYWTVSGGMLRKAQAHIGQASSTPVTGITPPGFDDAGNVVNGLGYTYNTIPYSSLANSNVLNTFDIIMVNSADSISVVGDEIALKSWVDDGGILYLSGTASEYLTKLAPGKVLFTKPNSDTGLINAGNDTISATIVDMNALLSLGFSSFDYKYPANRWTPIVGTSAGVHTLISADASGVVDTAGVTNLPTGYDFSNMPLAVYFEYGSGLVVYTNLHYRSGMSSSIKSALYYIVSLLYAHSLEATSHTLIDLTGYFQENDYAGFLEENGEAVWAFDSSKLDDLMIVLNANRGEFKIEIEGPDDTDKKLTASPPITMTFPGAAKGLWKVRITATDSGTGDFIPYVLSTGSRSLDKHFTTTVPYIIWRTPLVANTYTITLEVVDGQSRTDKLIQGLIVR